LEQSNPAKTLNKHKRVTTNCLHDINVFILFNHRNKTLRMSGVTIEATMGAKVFSNSFVLNMVAVGVLQVD